jgi:tetratricopeptide (TPR) repeat protein
LSSRTQEFAFRTIAVALPFCVLLLVELGFRLFGIGATDRYVNITPFSFFRRTTIDGVDSFVISSRFGYEHKNVFPVKRPKDGIRIFLLGASACAGWPHPPAETFGSYLQQALRIAYPDRSVEVINAAGHGFASYRVRKVFDQIIELDPDGIIIYSGNNEFLESREYGTGSARFIDAISDRSRLVSWLQSVVMPRPTSLSGEELNNVAGFFWAKVKQEALKLRSEPQLFARVKEHHGRSIKYMAEEAARRKVPVLLFTVPSNLRDWLPTVSYNRLKGDRFQEWSNLVELAEQHLFEGNNEGGIAALTKAIAMEPRHASSYFLLGRLYEAAGQKQDALRNYRLAKDLDYNPFRELSSFNQAIREISSETEGSFLIDLERIFDQESMAAAPGFDLFLDYVHPTKRGNLLIAKAAFAVLTDHKLFGAISASLAPIAAIWRGNSYDESSDEPLQRRMFELYAINHQYAAAYQQALHLHRLSTGGKTVDNCEELSPKLPAKVREGCKVFRRQLTTTQLQTVGRPAKDQVAELKDFYGRWYPYETFRRWARGHGHRRADRTERTR